MTPASRFRRALGGAVLIVALAAVAPAQTSAAKSSPLAKARQLLAAGQVDAAEQELWQRLSTNHDDAEALLLLGAVRLRQQRYPEAEALARRAVALAASGKAPLAAEAHAGVAAALEAQGKPLEALPERLEARRLDSANPSHAVALAALQRQQGQCPEALATLAGLKALPAAAAPVQAGCLLAAGRKIEARRMTLLVQGAAAAQLAIELAEVFLDGHEPEVAQTVLAGVLARPHPPARAFLLAGMAAEQRGQLASALPYYRRAVQLAPEDGEAQALLGGLLLRQGKTVEALPLLERGLQLAPDSLPALRAVVAAGLRVQRADLARPAAARLYQLSPENSDDVYLAGTAFVSVGSFQAAIDAFTHYLESKPDDARAELALGTAYRETRKLAEAETHLQRSQTLDPAQAEAAYQLAEVYIAQGQPNAARKLLEANSAGSHLHAPSLIALGKLDVEAGQNDEAATLLERAVALAPQSAEAHYQLSLAYKRLGKDAASQEQAQIFQRLRAEQHQAQNAAGDDAHPPM